MKLINRGVLCVAAWAVVCFTIVYFVGMRSGQDSGARQMARHILNTQYRTGSFEALVSEETGIDLEDRWGDGYDDCMESVIRALATCDEVRIGNLIIDAPNVTVTNSVFFAIDPNMAWIEAGMDAVNLTIQDNLIISLVSNDFKDRFKRKGRPTYNEGFKEGLECGKLPTIVYPDVKEMVYALCEEKGIDVNRPFGLTCPICGYAKFVNTENYGSYITYGFLAIPRDHAEEAKVTESTLHCGGCEHIFGSNWIVEGEKVAEKNNKS